MKYILDTIRKEILKNFPEIKTCLFYENGIRKFITPAVFLNISNYTPTDIPGTGELSLIANIEAFLVIENSIENAHLMCHDIITRLAHFIHLNNFGINIAPSEISSISEASFKPEFSNTVSFVLSWRQEILIGENIWTKDPEPLPNEVIIGD